VQNPPQIRPPEIEPEEAFYLFQPPPYKETIIAENVRAQIAWNLRPR